MEQSNIVNIVKPERVARIIERVCDARLDVLIRVPSQKKIAVRAKASAADQFGAPPTLKLTGLSAQGVKFLWNADIVQVDFVGMSTQMIFKTRVLTVDGTSVQLVFPKKLVSYDRRQNARYATTDQLAAFIKVGNWQPDRGDITAQPIFYPYQNLGSWIRIADISEGGMCGVTRFPAVLKTYERGFVDYDASIVFPMQAPVEAPMEVRWVRRIREGYTVGEDTYNQRVYKFGVQFVNPAENLMKLLKQFVHQISMSDAI